MQPKIVYNIAYYESDELIDSTQIDELSEELIWDLYKEFGHERTIDTRYEVESILEKE